MTNETTDSTPARRPFDIDMMGIQYGLDSDEIDALEREYAAKGAPLRLYQDYRFAFERVLIDGARSAAREVRAVMDEMERAASAPDVIARRYRLERIERAVKLFLESNKSQEEVWRAMSELKIAYYSPPMPPPDEPRLTRMELIALVEDAEAHLSATAYLDDYGRDKRQRDESRAAIAKARDIIARGESRISPERFTIAPDEERKP